MGIAFLWKRGYRIFKFSRNKLFASNKKHIGNHTLMFDMFYSYMSVVCTYHIVEVSLTIIFLVWLFFVDLIVAQI